MFRNSGEEKAWNYLNSQGHLLLEHNYRTPDRRTEIDLITLKHNAVHFVEVKDWKSGMPVVTQNRKRQVMVRRAAVIYMGSDRFHNSIMSIRKRSPLALPLDGDGLVVGCDVGVSRDSALQCDIDDELCHIEFRSALDTGEYSVSFDLISIINGKIEYIERLF